MGYSSSFHVIISLSDETNDDPPSAVALIEKDTVWISLGKNISLLGKAPSESPETFLPSIS